MQNEYVTSVLLKETPLAFLVYNDVFLVSNKESAEYIRIENKKKDNEAVVRFELWSNREVG